MRNNVNSRRFIDYHEYTYFIGNFYIYLTRDQHEERRIALKLKWRNKFTRLAFKKGNGAISCQSLPFYCCPASVNLSALYNVYKTNFPYTFWCAFPSTALDRDNDVVCSVCVCVCARE